MGDIFAGDDEILATVIDAAQHDMGVRALGIEVVDGDPIEPGANVLLGLRHQPPDIGFEVGIFGAVLGRDDEAELVAIADRLFEESLAIGCVGVRAIQLAGIALAGDAIALDVAQMRAGRAATLARQPHQPGLDDCAPAAKSGKAVTAG